MRDPSRTSPTTAYRQVHGPPAIPASLPEGEEPAPARPCRNDLPALRWRIPPETTPTTIHQVVMLTRGTARRLDPTTLILTPDPRIGDPGEMLALVRGLGWRLAPPDPAPPAAASRRQPP